MFINKLNLGGGPVKNIFLNSRFTYTYHNIRLKEPEEDYIEELVCKMGKLTLHEEMLTLNSIIESFEDTDTEWQKQVETENIKLMHVEQQEVNGMIPAKIIVIDKDCKATLQYKGKTIKSFQVSHADDVHRIMKESDCMVQCSGVVGEVYFKHAKGIHDSTKFITETVGSGFVTRSINCHQLIEASGRCGECSRAFIQLRKAISRNRHQQTTCHQSPKTKVKKLREQARYYKTQAKSQKEKLILIKQDAKDMEIMFNKLDESNSTSHLSERGRMLWDAQRECVKGKQNRWDPE